MRLSVVLPVFNGASFLAAAVKARKSVVVAGSDPAGGRDHRD